MNFTGEFCCWNGLSLIRKIVLCGLVAWSVVEAAASSASAAEDEKRVGEIGFQIGLRWVLGLAPGWIDVEWRGTQLHMGMVSVGSGRRIPLGPGF